MTQPQKAPTPVSNPLTPDERPTKKTPPSRDERPVDDPRDIERDPPGEMDFPGAEPEPPAKKVRTFELPRWADETRELGMPEPELARVEIVEPLVFA